MYVSSFHLHVFVLQLDMASTKDEVDELLSRREFMTIVDSSRWSLTATITLATKSQLIQRLIIDEVIEKRRQQMENLKKGLERLEVLSICLEHPEVCKSLFVHSKRELTLTSLWLIRCDDIQNSTVFVWFKDYLRSRESEKTGINTMLHVS